MICIESLDLYTIEKTQHINKFHLLSKRLKVFRARSSNNIRHANNNMNTSFEDYLQCIYLINKLIQKSTIQNIARDLLCKYDKDPEEISVKQYINKFVYYYKTTQYYYNVKSYFNTINIKEIAIQYLYIIQKIHQYNSLRYLTGYLCL